MSSSANITGNSPKHPWQMSDNELLTACAEHGIGTQGKSRQDLVNSLKCSEKMPTTQRRRSEFDLEKTRSIREMLEKTNLNHLIQDTGTG